MYVRATADEERQEKILPAAMANASPSHIQNNRVARARAREREEGKEQARRKYSMTMLIPGNVVRASRMRLRNRMWLCNTLVRLFLASIIITDLIGASKDERDAELIRSETGGGDVIARRQLTFTMMCKSEAKSRCDTNEIDVCVCGAVMVALENQFFQRQTNDRTNERQRTKNLSEVNLPVSFFFSSSSSPLFTMHFSCRCRRSLRAFSRIQWEQQRFFAVTSLLLLSLSSLGRIHDTRV